MIRDAARQERLLADIRRFVREVAIPNEDRVERDVRAFRIYEGTSQIYLLNIGKHLLKK